uniref:Uncharacterized protein n=1 Tax=Anguilla anguilla TaxID=7936 RepID=A0A0E9XQU6_ANGAN
MDHWDAFEYTGKFQAYLQTGWLQSPGQGGPVLALMAERRTGMCMRSTTMHLSVYSFKKHVDANGEFGQIGSYFGFLRKRFDKGRLLAGLPVCRGSDGVSFKNKRVKNFRA